jgi:hypothetical protein
MNISATRSSAQKTHGDMPREMEQRVERADESRALVATGPAAERGPATGFRQTPFLAQLIATRDQIAQTRERRRAEPEEAIAAYRATQALVKH